MKKAIYLKEFKVDELIFNEEETKEVLRFFFTGEYHQNLIAQYPITDTLRGFAQGLLVEGVDASYKLGIVDHTFKALGRKVIIPGVGMNRALKSFADGVQMHWFKHAKAKDLRDIKIYDAVRNKLANKFRTDLEDLFLAKKQKNYFVAMLDYQSILS